VRLVFLDELTYYRQPTLGSGYAAAGSAEPWARRAPRFNSPTRVVGVLEPSTGQVTAVQARSIGVAALVQFYARLQAAAPAVARWYVAQDNWPVHTHPDLLAALEPQLAPFPWYRPRGWPTAPAPRAVARWGAWRLPIQIVPLPTYAPWTNPIEQLWRWLKADVLHLHPWADDLEQLHGAVQAFLDGFAHGSPELLRYAGLGVPR
jgi:DDE superfamily endonuclease